MRASLFVCPLKRVVRVTSPASGFSLTGSPSESHQLRLARLATPLTGRGLPMRFEVSFQSLFWKCKSI